MGETPLNYDKQIWIIFSVGIISSLVVLYLFYQGNFQNWSLGALTLGFAILVYSSFSILNYNEKKKKLCEIIQEFPIQEEEYLLNRELSIMLDKAYYPRVRWVKEFILLILVIFYIYSFSLIGIFYVLIPILFICYFTLFHLYNNLKVLKN